MTPPALQRAWYLGCTPADLGEAAILLGDPARVARIANLLEEPHFLPEHRGLKTVTGRFKGKRLTIAAFGMGAPIACIVLHELAALGIRRFVRIGTAMAVDPVQLGDFVLAEAAFRAEGSSPTYAPPGYPAWTDYDLLTALRQTLQTDPSRRWHSGLFGSYDGFYTEMFAMHKAQPLPSDHLLADFAELGLIAADMETSALLTAGRRLGVQVATLCVATVNALSREKLASAAMASAEKALFQLTLTALADMAPARPSQLPSAKA